VSPRERAAPLGATAEDQGSDVSADTEVSVVRGGSTRPAAPSGSPRPRWKILNGSNPPPPSGASGEGERPASRYSTGAGREEEVVELTRRRWTRHLLTTSHPSAASLYAPKFRQRGSKVTTTGVGRHSVKPTIQRHQYHNRRRRAREEGATEPPRPRVLKKSCCPGNRGRWPRRYPRRRTRGLDGPRGPALTRANRGEARGAHHQPH
jgi:hypothetical protein